MTLKKAIGTIHLWLGLASGIVVFIVGITGCCYVFINEIHRFSHSWEYSKEEQKPLLLPSRIKTLAEQKIAGKTVSFVNYTPGQSAYAGAFGKDYGLGVYINPYSGKVLHVTDFRKGDFDFFNFVLAGHRSLWLPYGTGSKIVDAGVLMFLILLISGLVLWWPKNLKKANRDKSFTIKWSAKFKRVNYDLHNVLGFYALSVLFAIACTGLSWGYDWFARSLYRITSAGREAYPEYSSAISDTTKYNVYAVSETDSLWLMHLKGLKNVGSSVSFPQDKKDAIEISINYKPDIIYKQDVYDYDRYTLRPVKGTGVFFTRYSEASLANKIARMNYDIHTGQIVGLPGKIIAFFASLICASLPVTGFYIWWGKKKKKGKKSIKNKPIPVTVKKIKQVIN